MPLSSKRRTCQLFEVTSIELFFCISCLCAIHYSTLPNCWGFTSITLPSPNYWGDLPPIGTDCVCIQHCVRTFSEVFKFSLVMLCVQNLEGIQYHQMWLCCFVLVTWTAMVDLINMPLATWLVLMGVFIVAFLGCLRVIDWKHYKP